MARVTIPYIKTDAAATKFAVATTGCEVYYIEVSHPNTVHVYLQLFDLASGDVTVGTTTPTYAMFVPAGGAATAGGAMDKMFASPLTFSTALTAAVTTTATGNTAAASAAVVNIGRT